MGISSQKLLIVTAASSLGLLVAACGSDNNNAGADNVTTTDMVSTETSLDGTTNDASSLDAAAGVNNDIAIDSNSIDATSNSSAQ